ncbi:toll/interleukin-1 receptor domain-containing protein [Burkholderia semiarida]|uniref:toll/interleukin-1 receptor domain-containing protein n=1 Tax=Burkholderia TaxID=32008 RepID=UPI00265DAFAE|nr:toll/interleukin-1 receptor domain-containing protein [Burkholderia sp. AU44665]MDN7703340.1 toll/interleukin-1 receptor domain-containing protein [Burkholderia sp. AU44665]
MSWDDYTRAEVFGTGIHRPASDVLAAVETALDARLFNIPGLAKKFLPLHKRDILIQREQNYVLVVVSTEPARHRPMHIDRPSAIEHLEIGDAPVTKPRLYESQVVANAALIALGYDRIIEPLLLLLPPDFLNKSLDQLNGQAIRDAAEVVFQYELQLYGEQVHADMPKKIFLSHKSSNKAIVRDVANTLKEIGFDPWLDEDRMVAGSNLEREIKQGMMDSCAAVFFVTPDFTDEDWIAREVDHAMTEKRKKGERFAIVPLRLTSPDGRTGKIIEMFEEYLHPNVAHHQIVLEILKAIPVQMGQKVAWKTGK